MSGQMLGERVKIESMHAFLVLDSRANFTVASVINNGIGISPAGASVGSNEVKVLEAKEVVKRINKMEGKYKGEELSQEQFDRELKFIKHKIGGNGTISLSFAFFNNYSTNLLWSKINDAETLVFPYPVGNVMGGGVHNGRMNIQELLVIPVKAKGFREAIEHMISIYHEIKDTLKKRKKFLGYNDESALISTLDDEKSLELVDEISSRYGAKIGVDVAANSFYCKGKYKYKKRKAKSREEHIDYIVELAKRYNIYYIEDPLYEQDVEGFREIKKRLRRRLIVGDDITVTDAKRIKECLEKKAISGAIIKPNQIGTLTEAIEAKEVLEKGKGVPIISHRSGETPDSTISRMALLFKFPFIKAGVGGIRVVKLNELLMWWDRVEHKKMSAIKG